MIHFASLVTHDLAMGSLFDALQIPRGDVAMYGPFFQRPTKLQRGCQVDLLIQTRFRNLYLCEIKFLNDKVGADVIRQMVETRNRLRCRRGYSKRSVLIHVNGFTQGVRESRDVDHIVDFAELLEV